MYGESIFKKSRCVPDANMNINNNTTSIIVTTLNVCSIFVTQRCRACKYKKRKQNFTEKIVICCHSILDKPFSLSLFRFLFSLILSFNSSSPAHSRQLSSHGSNALTIVKKKINASRMHFTLYYKLHAMIEPISELNAS